MDFSTTMADAAPAWAPLQELPRVGRAPGAMPQCSGCSARHRCLPAGLSEGETRCRCSVTIGRRRVRRGVSLYREGERFQFLYAVRFGSFKSSCTLQNGVDQVTAFHLPGDVIGFDASAASQHPTTAVALEDSEVCVLPYSQLTDACGEQRGLRLQLMRMASAELVREQRLLALIAHTHTEQRVAAFLVQLSQRMRERGFSSSEFLLRMTRADIGSYLGTTLETVSRSLSSFSRRGYVSVRRRHIQLVDIAALHSEFASALP
jgi:CRP/FNR family transcriptional regulator